jgi:hypothetical protein
MSKWLLTTVSLLALAVPAQAAVITTAIQQSIASSAPFPAAVGTHTHSTLGQAVEVGSFFTAEEVRGVAEFNLAAEGVAPSAAASFRVNQLGSSYFGQTGPGNYTIEVYAYTGDNAIQITDFQAAGTLVGSFSTAGLTVGQVLSFDVTSAFNGNVGGSLGLRLQPSTNPGNNVANQFTDFRITTSEAVPEPTTLTMFGLGALGFAGAALRRRFRKVA